LYNVKRPIYNFCKYSKRKPYLNLLFVVLLHVKHVKKSKHIITKLNDTISSSLYKWTL